MAKYNGYSINTVKKLYAIGTEASGERELSNTLEEAGYVDYDAMQIAMAGYLYGSEITIEEKEYYRIGEPAIAYDQYLPSSNFAENKKEAGVSIITTKWLHSISAIFFSDKAARGIYKMTGTVIGFGGDDEPVIYPTNWAEKTNIKNLDELEKIL